MPGAYYPPPTTDPTKQPLDPTLTAFAGLPGGGSQLPYFTAVDSLAQTTLTSYARSLIDDNTAAESRATLGLGNMATQSAGAVAITGGNMTNTDVNFPIPSTTRPAFTFGLGGTAPTSPQNGWFWMVGGNMFLRINNQTQRINTTVV